VPRTYKIYRLTDIAGRIYLWYREKIWGYYHRALKEGVYNPPDKPKSYHYFELSIPDDMTSFDVLALVWYAVYYNAYSNAPTIEESRAYLSKLHRTKISRGVNFFVNTIARALWITKEQLLCLAYRSVEDVTDLPRTKRRVTFIEPRLKEIAVLERMKPLEALFGISALYLASKKWGRGSDHSNTGDSSKR